MSAEYSTRSQLLKVGQADPGEGVEEIGLRRADALRGLGTGAKGAADCHAVIVRATRTRKHLHPCPPHVLDLRAAGGTVGAIKGWRDAVCWPRCFGCDDETSLIIHGWDG
ncbi:hypothetical protein AQI95_06255 [Streptomyces yokosukanensis]|uniref:Uncharacterized protein n=1 Tax=Streptomyces yokosukanensis TaxID=67386 RepID=A0A101PD94_9ACTN|nr:hypothetical protein AQI95_06255 [Streptomyces yokosukanensis]